MTENEILQAAQMLYNAEKNNRQCGLISLAYPDITLEESYKIQAGFTALKETAGAKPIGWKIGLTSRAMQQALGIDTPDSGVLFEDMRFHTGEKVPGGRFIQPRIEAEIAFIIKDDLRGEDITDQAVRSATAYVTPSIEILDTRVLRLDPISGKARSIYDTVADNAANAGVVLGRERHAINEIDLRWIGVIVKRDGIVEETGLGAGILDDPVTSIVWLVRRLAQYGKGISAGDIILSGSFIRPLEALPGSRFEADFGDFGRINLSFA